MTRWKITVEYDGSGFYGWQRQARDVSVQQVLEEAVHKFSGETVTLHVAGRTDSGVHARANVAHFDLERATTADIVRDALNFYVRPHRVALVRVDAVADTFHARFDALSRRYRYQMVNRRAPLTFLCEQAWHVPKPLDVDVMNGAAQLLIGTHDFTTFRAQNCQAKSPLRTLEHMGVERDGEIVTLDVRARSFLYHQVRNMVGTLVYVGTGQWSLDDFKAAFAARSRQAGGPTAPPQGLFFWDVVYPV